MKQFHITWFVHDFQIYLWFKKRIIAYHYSNTYIYHVKVNNDVIGTTLFPWWFCINDLQYVLVQLNLNEQLDTCLRVSLETMHVSNYKRNG